MSGFGHASGALGRIVRLLPLYCVVRPHCVAQYALDFHMLSVTENDEKGVVVIDGREIDGFIDERVCQKCERARIYYDEYDAFFCAFCKMWLESRCSDATCEYCRSRPEKPIN